ncbi:MAG TPA: serine/threonine-protein kinase, partial [Nannocystaceae bacterium]|nr:serine/threonine-protein kinase [Nannocystaceae bacterium]
MPPAADTSEPGTTSIPPLPRPQSEDGVEAAAIRGRLAARLFGAAAEVIRIGRYEVLARIGAGGMGVVYSARDPDLDRLVALKVLSGQRGRDPHHRQRLLDEARALARLSHPNVVQIHEVGEHEGVIFLALELIEGETLAQWQRRPDRRWREILAAYLDAARGLAAAHGVGVIHRDVKPSNALIGVDGRVRVVDFGLARAELTDSTTGDDASSASRTRPATAGVAGTPAYMSPEQAAGRPLDPRSDVFSLAVSLFEALFGRRPFDPLDPQDLLARGAVTYAELHGLLPRSTAVPAWVVHILARALQPDPDRRLPDMAALVAAFDEAPRRIARRRALAGGLLGVGVLAGALTSLPTSRPACPEIVDTLPGAWDPTTRAAIHDRFRATGLPYAEFAWGTLETSFTSAILAWSRERESVCIQTKIEGTHTEAHLDSASECLRKHERSLRDLAGRLALATPTVVTQAHRLLAVVPDPARCTSAAALRQGPPPAPPYLHTLVDKLRRDLDDVRYLITTADYTTAAARADELLAASTIHPPLHADALFTRGVVDARRGALDDAEARLRAAAALAESTHDDPLAVAILGELIDLASRSRRDLTSARIYADLLGAKLRRLGAEGPPLADYHDRLGRIALLGADPATALAEHVLARTLQRSDDLLTGARNAEDRANALAELGRYDESVNLLNDSHRSLAHDLGVDHPDTARVAYNLARSLRERPTASPADLDRAEQLLRDALEVFRQRHGDPSLLAARTRIALADVLAARAHNNEAAALLPSAMSVLRDMSPAHDAELINALALAINLAIDRRDWPAAAVATADLIRLLRAHGDTPPLDLLVNAGEFQLRTGDVVASIPYFDQALTLAVI